MHAFPPVHVSLDIDGVLVYRLSMEQVQSLGAVDENRVLSFEIRRGAQSIRHRYLQTSALSAFVTWLSERPQVTIGVCSRNYENRNKVILRRIPILGGGRLYDLVRSQLGLWSSQHLAQTAGSIFDFKDLGKYSVPTTRLIHVDDKEESVLPEHRRHALHVPGELNWSSDLPEQRTTLGYRETDKLFYATGMLEQAISQLQEDPNRSSDEVLDRLQERARNDLQFVNERVETGRLLLEGVSRTYSTSTATLSCPHELKDK